MSDENTGGVDDAAPQSGEQNLGGGGSPSEATNQPVDWTEGLPDDLKGYVGNKAWKDPTALVQSYRDLEKLAGAKSNFIEKPDPSDADAVSATLQKLGAPTDVAGYKIDLPDGVTADENMLGGFKEQALKLGILPHQAQGMVEWFEGHKATASEVSAAALQEQAEKEINDLKRELGRDYDTTIAAGQTAVRKLGIDPDILDGLEAHMGAAAVIKLNAKLGQALGEKGLITADDEAQSGAMTREQAKAEIARLGSDDAYRQRLFNPTNMGHASAKQEMERLQRTAAGV